jgi:type III secretion protein L
MEESSKIVKVIKSKDKATSTISDELTLGSIEQDGIIRGEVYSASAKAREILRKAQQEAEEIIRKVTQESDQQRQNGYQAGYQEGLAQATEVLLRARGDYEQLLKNANRDLMDLAFKIAEKIIGKQLQIDKTTIQSIVSQAMQGIRQSKQITIRVNPADAKALKENEEELLEKLAGQRTLDFVEDKKVQPGGCIIESEIGIVDAQLQTQLERLRKVLIQAKPV